MAEQPILQPVPRPRPPAPRPPIGPPHVSILASGCIAASGCIWCIGAKSTIGKPGMTQDPDGPVNLLWEVDTIIIALQKLRERIRRMAQQDGPPRKPRKAGKE